MPCTGERCDPDGLGSSAEQSAGGSTGGGAGGQDVIDNKHILASNESRVRDAERVAQVNAALTRSESGLTFCGALAEQGCGCKFQIPGRMRFVQGCEGMHCEEARLVESAACLLGGVQRNGDDEQLRRCFCGKLLYRVGQHVTQRSSGRFEATVFEGVDGVAHATFIGGPCDGALKGGRAHAAGTAKRLIAAWRCGNAVSASLAMGTGAVWKLSPADIADWNGKELRQEVAAQDAASGIEDATEEIRGTSENARHCAPTGSLRRRAFERE
jgi:hypothetical protein